MGQFLEAAPISAMLTFRVHPQLIEQRQLTLGFT
jgi:hypothetical protein